MTMIKKLALAGVAALAFAATPAAAAGPYTPPTANGKAKVRLYNQITLSKVTDVDFGVVIRGAGAWGAETVSMDDTGTVTCVGADLSCTGSPSVGEFTIKGDNNSDMSVKITGADFDAANNELTLRNGTDTLVMSVQYGSTLTQDVDLTDPLNPVTLETFQVTGTGSDQTILLYGDLAVKNTSSAANGYYEANYTLEADYK